MGDKNRGCTSSSASSPCSSRTVLNLLIPLFFGVVLRLVLILSSYQKEVSDRVEVSTPVSSWKRAVEGVHLMEMSVSPYQGDTFHETPLSLQLYRFLLNSLRTWTPMAFIVTDVLTALCLTISSFWQLKQISFWEKERLEKLKEETSRKLEINEKRVWELASRVGAIYLLSPYAILSCTGLSTSVFTNFLTALLMLTTTSGLRVASCAVAALLTYQTLYPVMLIIPVMMALEQRRCNLSEPKGSLGPPSGRLWVSYVFTLSLFFAFVSSLLFISFSLMDNNWDFLWSTYGFLLTVPDFTPNIGLFWYFFTEMFDHFRDFFLWTFQINSFVYAIPLAISLRKNPHVLYFVLLILLSLFKPYPSVSDFSLYLALLPQWTHLFNYMKQGLIVGCMFISCSVLAPILWHMWIMMGTANSNYYFGVSLAFNTAQIFLVTDLLFAFTKREFYLDNGIVKGKGGNPARLELVYN